MATFVGLLHLKLHVPGSTSLKDKRRAVKSFKDRLGNAFNAAVAEVDALDSHRQAVIAVAVVGNDKQYLDGVIQKIVSIASMHRDMVLMDQEVQWL